MYVFPPTDRNSHKIPVQTPHPTTVCSFLCLELSKMRKNKNLADTEAYNTPRKMMVGIMNENEIFLNTGCRDPNAGAVMYWFPV